MYVVRVMEDTRGRGDAALRPGFGRDQAWFLLFGADEDFVAVALTGGDLGTRLG